MLLVHCSSLRPFCFVHAWGVRVVFVDHEALGILQVASLHLKPWASLVDFIHSHFVQFFLVSERGRRRKLPAERSALYNLPLLL